MKIAGASVRDTSELVSELASRVDGLEAVLELHVSAAAAVGGERLVRCSEETAAALGVSASTVRRDCRFAKALLSVRLKDCETGQ